MTEVNNNSTPMQILPSDIPVERIPMPENFSSEEDATHLYIPKGTENYATSLQPRFNLPAGIYGPVRSHFIVASTVSANAVDRQRSLDQLRRMSADGDAMAADALKALDGLEIK